jgi:hypothetical protein
MRQISLILIVKFAASIVVLSPVSSLAADGYYMGLWATDKEACSAKGSPNRLLLQQTDLRTPQFQCKLLGLRQDDESGMVFKASCSDPSTKWNDEIAVKANATELTLMLKSDGQRRRYVRCSS